MAKRVVLASSSPRRIALLGSLVDMFMVIRPTAEEAVLPDARLTPMFNAFQKGASVFVSAHKNDIVIGCDTVVVYRSKIIGKPKDKAAAKKTLQLLRGKKHFVFSGVSVFSLEKNTTFCVGSRVTLKELTDEEIDSYIEEYNPLDKAGAYGIQDSVVVESYEGEYENIVGLPLIQLSKILKELGVNVKQVLC